MAGVEACDDAGDNFRTLRSPYSTPIGKTSGKTRVDESAGTLVEARWESGSLSFTVNGEDCGPAFSPGDGAVPCEGSLYPFIAYYARKGNRSVLRVSTYE